MAGEGTGSPDFVPSPLPAEFEWSFQDTPLGYTSPWTGTTQTLATFGGLWTARATWTSFERKDLVPIAAQLNYWGVTRAFTMYMFDQPSPLRHNISPIAAALDSLLVDGAGQIGFELDVTSSQNGTILEVGDLIGFTSSANSLPQLFQLREDLTISGGAGTALLSQPIRVAPQNDCQIITSYIPVRMKLTRSPSIRVSSQLIYSIDAEFVEVRV